MKDVLTGRVGRLNERITSWVARIAAVALALIAVVTFCDVIARKVFNSGFTFTVEMTEMLMALIVFLGVGLVTHQRGHIVVDVLTLRLSERSRVWLGLVTNLLSLGFVLLMVWRMWVQAAFISSKGDITPIWNIPFWPIPYPIPPPTPFPSPPFFLPPPPCAHPQKLGAGTRRGAFPGLGRAPRHVAVDPRHPDPRPAVRAAGRRHAARLRHGAERIPGHAAADRRQCVAGAARPDGLRDGARLQPVGDPHARADGLHRRRSRAQRIAL